MAKMTFEECKAFLVGQVRTAKLATVRPDGRPHVVPVWFDLDGDTVVFTMWHETVKATNIRRDPRICLCVDEETPPFSYVQIDGVAVISTDMDQLSYWANRIAGKYMGAELAETYGQRYSVEGELLVHVTPARFIGQKDIVT
jgi:PPOX class probable F420-dependent enzyme